VLVFGSRGMTSRYRHLMLDFRALIPHHKKESKLDSRDNLAVVNEIAEMKSCDTTVFFDVRKKRDLFLWLAHTPSGPSVKFHVVNVHTMDELRLTGNCLKGSRPVLSFDRAFDEPERAPHLRLIRELLAQTFGVPKGHPKSQPFHDHVLSFGWADGKVWMRHYQVVDKAGDAKEAARLLAAGEQPTVLVEIGPRCVLQPVRVFGGSMGGPTLWTNPAYVSPNALRHELAVARAGKYVSRQNAATARAGRAEELVLPADPLGDVFQ
jgi:ribosome biogenesis protein BRX1